MAAAVPEIIDIRGLYFPNGVLRRDHLDTSGVAADAANICPGVAVTPEALAAELVRQLPAAPQQT